MTTRLLQTLTVLALMTGASFAADLNAIVQHARSVEMDAKQIVAALKSKNFDANEIKAKLEEKGKTIADLKEAVAAYEAANPSVAGTAAWKDVKDRVTLLEIFLNRKVDLLNDARKNRTMLRAHADGIAKRAAGLQQSASQLQRVSTSASGS
jgi:hypothetical protein